MLIDTHAHLNFNAFKNDASDVIYRSLDNGIWMINIGSQYATSKKAVEIAEKYGEGVYAAIGLHPINLETGLVKIKEDQEEIEARNREKDFDYEKYKELALSSKKVVAIGEIGLDYYWKPKTKTKLQQFKEKQRTVLCQQLNLAKELSLPVIFHCRMAHQDLIEVISNFQFLISKPKGVMHGFVGTAGQLKKYLDFGFYIGFNGIIFKSIEGINFEENIIKTPLERILIETDCPYLTPPPEEGRNEPLYVKHVAEKIAKIKNLSYEEVAQITTGNAKKLFNI